MHSSWSYIYESDFVPWEKNEHHSMSDRLLVNAFDPVLSKV